MKFPSFSGNPENREEVVGEPPLFAAGLGGDQLEITLTSLKIPLEF